MIWLFNWFVKITGYLPQKLVFRTKVHCEDPKTQNRHIRGPAIVICNHTSVMDYAALIFVFFTRTFRCQAAELQYDKPWMAFFLNRLGAVRVDRSFKDMSCIAKSEKILQKSGVLGIFPEGRLPLEGEKLPMPFQSGAAYIALQTNVPVIPVYTNGAYFSRERAEVVIGKPVDVWTLYDKSKSEHDNLKFISEEMQKRVYALKKYVGRCQKSKRKLVLNRVAYAFVKITAALPALLWLRPKWVRTDQEKKRIRGGALLVCNHNSFYDPIALMVGVFYRRIRFVATQELFAGRFRGWLFKEAFCCIPINRQRLDMQTFRDVNEALQNDEVVAMFPEGHVMTEKQSGLGMMHSGMVLMAAQSGRPIVPAYILPPEKWYNRMRIAVGSPITVNTGKKLPFMEDVVRITDEVSSVMNRLREYCLNDKRKK